MGKATYSLRRIYKKPASGITQPKYCTINAVLKLDGKESPQCVYNEKAATNIAQTLHVPNAIGVLADKPSAHSYASLEIAKPSIPLPNIRKSQIHEAAKHYPDHVAGLVAFDILIGNTDRYQNLKVSLFAPQIPVFFAFDHSHALLHPYHKPIGAIALLRSKELIAQNHPFYGRVKRNLLYKWCARFEEIPDYLIQECCEFGQPINTVDTLTQEKLGAALVWRKNHITEICRMHEHIIKSIP